MTTKRSKPPLPLSPRRGAMPHMDYQSVVSSIEKPASTSPLLWARAREVYYGAKLTCHFSIIWGLFLCWISIMEDDDDVFFIYMGGGRSFSSERCRTRPLPSNCCHGDSRECILHRQRLVKVELCGGLREMKNKHFNIVSTCFQWRFQNTLF